jgi:hypothetical protein
MLLDHQKNKVVFENKSYRLSQKLPIRKIRRESSNRIIWYPIWKKFGVQRNNEKMKKNKITYNSTSKTLLTARFFYDYNPK